MSAHLLPAGETRDVPNWDAKAGRGERPRAVPTGVNLCLLLHGIGPIPNRIEAHEARYWIKTRTFERLLRSARASKNRIRITFDDGNDTDVRVALPALKRAGMTATFFVLTDCIGKPGFLSEDDIRTLDAEGMEIGSHGSAHLCWTRACNADIDVDVRQSIARLEEITGSAIKSVAVPYGDCDRRVLGVLRSLGIARVYSSFRGPDTGKNWIVRRECLTAEMSDEEIETMITREYGPDDETISMLRTLRHAGAATFWPAEV